MVYHSLLEVLKYLNFADMVQVDLRKYLVKLNMNWFMNDSVSRSDTKPAGLAPYHQIWNIKFSAPYF